MNEEAVQKWQAKFKFLKVETKLTDDHDHLCITSIQSPYLFKNVDGKTEMKLPSVVRKIEEGVLEEILHTSGGKLHIIMKEDEDYWDFDHEPLSLAGTFRNSNCLEEIEITVDNMDIPLDICGAFDGCKSLRRACINSAVSDADYAFMNCTSLESAFLFLECCESAVGVFKNCIRLKDVNIFVSPFNDYRTKFCTDASEMFYDCNSIEEIDLRPCSLEKAESLRQMFFRCISLKKVIFPKESLSSFNVDMEEMFAFCRELKEIQNDCFVEFDQVPESMRKDIFLGCDLEEKEYMVDIKK